MAASIATVTAAGSSGTPALENLSEKGGAKGMGITGIRCRRETFTVWSSRAGDGTVNTRHLSPRSGGPALMDFAGA